MSLNAFLPISLKSQSSTQKEKKTGVDSLNSYSREATEIFSVANIALLGFKAIKKSDSQKI
jgi:hypothetical protein